MIFVQGLALLGFSMFFWGVIHAPCDILPSSLFLQGHVRYVVICKAWQLCGLGLTESDVLCVVSGAIYAEPSLSPPKMIKWNQAFNT